MLVYNVGEEEHLQHLRLVLSTLQKRQLHVRLSKCVFETKQLSYLGHVNSQGVFKMKADKVEAVRGWRPPRTIKQLRSFLGLAGYYRKVVQGYADCGTIGGANEERHIQLG